MGDVALLLDVMDTLVYDPIHHEIPAFFSMDLDALVREKHPDAWVRFERGEIEEAAFLRSFFADGRAYDEEGFVAAIENAYRYLDGIEPLLSELRHQKVPMFALSNYPSWYLRIERRLSLSRYLDWSLVSCLTGIRKPEAEAYLGAARALGRAPEQCVFVDDRKRNVKAALSCGMRAIHFTSAAQLRAELTALELLPPQGASG